MLRGVKGGSEGRTRPRHYSTKDRPCKGIDVITKTKIQVYIHVELNSCSSHPSIVLNNIICFTTNQKLVS